MNRRLSLTTLGTILIFLFFLLLPTSVIGQGSTETILFQANFDGGNADSWNLEPGWQVEKDGDNFVLSGEGHKWARLISRYTWDDFRLRVKVKLVNGAIHLNYRMSDGGRYPISVGSNGTNLSKQYFPNTIFNNLATNATANVMGEWHTVEIVGRRGNIKVLVNGDLRIDYADPEPLLSGAIAFEAFDDSHVHLDDVTVTRLASTEKTDSGMVWMRTGGPLGGLGYDIRVRPDNPNIMYVTDAWAGVHMSKDAGQTWVPLNEGIELRTGPSGDAIPVFCLTIDPNNYDVIWIGMQNKRGVYRSTDAGKTWQRRTAGIVEGDGLSIRGIAVEPGNSNVVYAAGEISSWEWAGKPISGREFDLTKGIVYKSTDAGMNWQAIWRGDNLARYVLIDPTNVNTLYVSTGIFDREAANSNSPSSTPGGGVGILKSTDGGRTWVQINEGLGNLFIGSLFMHPKNPQILLAGAGNNAYLQGGGIYLTRDGGAHWNYKGGKNITSVEFAIGDPNVAYAGGDQEDFYRSSDGGQTWQRFVRDGTGRWGPEGIRPGFPIDFQVDLHNAMRIFVNNYGGGNFLSEDGGKTWRSASTGYTGADLTDVTAHPQNPLIVFANGRSGPFKSIDGGTTWRGINPITVMEIAEGARLAIDPLEPFHILMSSAHWGWTYESKDGGETWTLVTNYNTELQQLPYPDANQKFQGMQAIAFAPSNSRKVYGGFGVWRCATNADDNMCHTHPLVSILLSDDGGHTWRRLTGTALDDYTVTQIVVHPTNADIAWAATAGGGVFRTDNGGTTWTSVSSGLTDKQVMGLAINPKTPEVLYAGTVNKGVFKTLDGGATWRAVSAGMNPTESIGSLVVNPVQPNIVYAGSWSSGVFMSTDDGDSWRLLNDGLRTRSVRALAISSDGKVVYAGTRGEGVFRLGDLPPQSLATAKPTASLTPTVSSTSTPTQVPSANILFQDNFETGNAGVWTLESGWQIEKDGTNVVLSGEGHKWARLATRRTWDDFRLRAKVQVIAGSIHLNYRFSDCIRYFIGFMANQVSLSKTMPCGTHTNLISKPGNYSPNRWHTVEIVGAGGNIKIFVNDVQQIDYTDPDPLLTGSIAFETLDNAHVHIDDVMVIGTAPTPTATPNR
jgi:photosystem II stability/assembly factor-like uncharacterized protein